MRLKHLLRLQYGSALPADVRQEGAAVVYGSNGPVGRHNIANMLAPAIVIGRKGSHGKVVWAESGGYCIDTALFVDQRYCKANLRFVYYLLQSLGLDETSRDSAVPGLDRSEAHNQQVPHFEVGRQRSIADFLDREIVRIDQLLEKRERFLRLVDERRIALNALAINGSILDSSPGDQHGWFGALPSGWKALRGKFLFRERDSRSATGEEELLTVSHITGVTARAEKDVNMFLAESTEGYKLVFKGDVVVNTMWAWMAALGVSPLDGLISPSYGVYTPIGNHFTFKYLDLLLRSRPFIAEVNRRSKGIWSSRLRLYPDAFLDILFPVPSIDVQNEILAALQSATGPENKLVNASVMSIDRLKEFRSALITGAVTGQIDVMTWSECRHADRRLDQIEAEMARQEATA